MGRAEAEVEVGAPLAEVWELYFDADRWPIWVDGFASVDGSDRYPEVGGQLRWRSTPVGRGEVTERVLAHEPRTSHRVAYADPGSEGELEVRFEMVPAGGGERRTRVSVTQSYELVAGGMIRPVLDRLFVRSQIRGALERTLGELKREAEDSFTRS